ncbi:cardiolipin synthase [Bacillus massilinigeriensis]|uniref:cardiolipin synthase n=1 Tax=Bacillus mediterraneensis TaxID=1805474 RepID=UPI0008F8333F|nr:cardiolipin synthase [Bacillus mediterraneensis]
MGILYWLAAAAAGITLIVCCDFYIGRKLHLKDLRKMAFPARLGKMDIFTRGPELFSDYFAELTRAAEHIHIVFYIVKNDKISAEFLSILKEKALGGVEVRLLIDWEGSAVSGKSVRELKDAGVEVAFSCKPKLPFLFYTSQVRNHRKITIIDGKIGYLGGFNVGKEYVDGDKKLSPWRDYHLKLTGQGVQDLQSVFLSDWSKAAGVNHVNNSVYFPEQPLGKVRHQLVPTEGMLLEGTVARLIQKAEDSIIIGTPYFIPSRKVFNLLLRALENGVTLSILVPYRADHPLVKEASYPFLRQLMKRGAKVYQYVGGFYHAKVLVIDEGLCDVGTANFDKRSLFLNRELNCLIFDHDFIRTVRNVLETDMRHSRRLRLRELNSFNPFRSLKEAAARTISYFL